MERIAFDFHKQRFATMKKSANKVADHLFCDHGTFLHHEVAAIQWSSYCFILKTVACLGLESAGWRSQWSCRYKFKVTVVVRQFLLSFQIDQRVAFKTRPYLIRSGQARSLLEMLAFNKLSDGQSAFLREYLEFISVFDKTRVYAFVRSAAAPK